MTTQKWQNKNSILKLNGNDSNSKINFTKMSEPFTFNLRKPWTAYTIQQFYIKSWQRNEMKKSQI